MTIWSFTLTPSGESVKTVTVLADGAAQLGAARGLVRGPSMMSVTVTMFGMSGARPTAPFQVNAAAAVLNGVAGEPGQGRAPVAAPSVVAGSPRVSVPGYGVLKTLGN